MLFEIIIAYTFCDPFCCVFWSHPVFAAYYDFRCPPLPLWFLFCWLSVV
jgi:hypothetical protein